MDKTPPRGRVNIVEYNYDYDEQCHRIRKTYKDTVTNYTYSGDKLVIEDGPKGKLFFLYDENGQLYGFVKDEKKYFYIKDITGTILGIVNESGTLVGKYEYSAYGKCTILVDTDGIATLNPFRFKCYYYDTESGMYYCQTRYFVPEWGRWLNADSPNFLQFDNINGMNLFAYCNNSPVMYSDPSGQIGLSFIFFSMLIGGLIGGALSYAEASKANLTGWDKLLATLGGVIFGAATSGAFALGGAAVVGLTVAGKAISGVTLFGIATFGTATAGALNYTLKSIAYDITGYSFNILNKQFFVYTV